MQDHDASLNLLYVPVASENTLYSTENERMHVSLQNQLFCRPAAEHEEIKGGSKRAAEIAGAIRKGRITFRAAAKTFDISVDSLQKRVSGSVSIASDMFRFRIRYPFLVKTE